MVLCLFLYSCKKESRDDHFLKAKIVQTLDVSCSLPVLDFSEDSLAIQKITDLNSITYSVLGLPPGFVIQNKNLFVLVRTPKPEEQFPCNTLGIGYPHLKILTAKER